MSLEKPGGHWLTKLVLFTQEANTLHTDIYHISIYTYIHYSTLVLCACQAQVLILPLHKAQRNMRHMPYTVVIAQLAGSSHLRGHHCTGSWVAVCEAVYMTLGGAKAKSGICAYCRCVACVSSFCFNLRMRPVRFLLCDIGLWIWHFEQLLWFGCFFAQVNRMMDEWWFYEWW